MTKSGKEFHNLTAKGKNKNKICISYGCKLDEFQVMAKGRNWRYGNMIVGLKQGC